jgi:hypothetical protein
MPDINIGSKLDAKGFKQADTALNKLSNNAKSLAKTFGVTFGATAVLAYAKKSIKAAAEDQAAQASLAQTLKNLGLETGNTAAAVNAFISNLERQTGIVDDELRPAMDRLLRATGSVTESEKLLGLALDISAGTGKDLTQVTQGLQKAFLGNVQSLGRLGVGLTKAELKTGNFADITEKLTDLFAGQAQRQADSFKGSIDKLAVAANNASESIGTGLIDAIALLAGDGGIKSATKAMEDFGVTAANVLVGTASYVDKLLDAFNGKDGGGGNNFKLENFSALLLPFIGKGGIFEKIVSEGERVSAQGQSSAAGLAHLAELQAKYTIKTLNAKKTLTKEESKALNNAKLKLAIDKANLALGKGSNIFDMEKIQLAAAEKSAAEQLGKVTSQAQLLQITNDLARLEVKQSILALEEAIATGDVKAITAATNKLNADLGILGVLTGQKVKLTEIESILKGILPKDLINLANLNEAIRLLGVSGAGTGNPMASHATPILGDPNKSPTSVPGSSPVLIPSIYAFGQRPNQGGGFDFFDPEKVGMFSAGSSGTKGTTVVVNVNAGTIANPDQLTTIIQDAVISLNKRGDLLTYAGSL